MNLCAGESEKVVLWNIIMKYYFPEVVNLVKEFMECDEMFSLVEKFVECHVGGQRVEKENV